MSYRRRNSDTEKPYELIPFDIQGVKRKIPDGHQAVQSGRLSGRMEIYLFPRVPLQVASGTMRVNRTRRGDEVVAEQSTIQWYNKKREPFSISVLPGSSLKGALRTLVEILSPSCVPLDSRQSGSAIPKSLRSCKKVDQLCPACRLFGMSGAKQDNYLGQVHIQDAILERGEDIITHTPLLWTPARGKGGLPARYLDEGKARGRKLYYHSQPAEGPDARVALKIGSRLRTWLHFENLTPGELGLLITAWGLHPEPKYSFLPKIGAAKPVGLGTVEVHITLVELYGNIKKSGRLGGKSEHWDIRDALPEKINLWVKAADEEGLLLRKALHNVYEVLKAENLGRPPHDEPY